MVNKQPEALWLADELDVGIFVDQGGDHCAVVDLAAAELRRLHEQNEKFKWQVRDTCARAEKAEAENERLRFALQGLHDDVMDYIRLNKLGGENNHWLKIARDVLGDTIDE